MFKKINNMELQCLVSHRRKLLIGTFLLFFVGVFLCSCNKTEKEINDLYSSGVVLVQNSGYYELKIDDELSVYFSNYSEEGDLENFTFDKDSIVVATSYGTGFFVSEFGEIVTNHHVVASTVLEKEASKSLKKMFKAVKEECLVEYNEYNNLMAELLNITTKYERNYSATGYISENDYNTYQNASNYVKMCKEKLEYCEFLYRLVDNIDMSDAELKYANKVSIAYNDEYITSATDFVPCVVKKTDEKNDLAIIQLSSKKTPEDKAIFEILDENPMETSSLFYPGKNDKLIMIGFNLGPALALTENGVLSQCTSGMITQERDNCYMYSIPSLHGSSGSPVVNQKGELVAINFAGLDFTQNFNYGIKVDFLRRLYNNY